jgi:hypothetical protein
MQHESKAPDCHQSNIPERATGRRTSPSVHACPTPHRGKTPSRPAHHSPMRSLPPQVRPAASSTRPTASAYPRCQAPPPGTQGFAWTPDARPRRMSAPCTQARAEHVCQACTGGAGPGNRVFCIWQPCARDPGNKTAVSAHGMGSGGLAVDAMAIGCMGVERREVSSSYFLDDE